MQPTQEEYDRYTKDIERSLEEERQRSGDLAKANYGQMNLFNQENEENLIRWQLDMREDLDRLYHLLKGDILKEDEDGNVFYEEQKDPNLRPFNEFGVQILMNVMSFYLNRNTILSNYDDPTIQWKVHDFGVEVSDLIFNRYDEMMVTLTQEEGEDTNEFKRKVDDHLLNKMKFYPMIVKELVDTVHSAYLRAYHGGERESLRTARTVTQMQPLVSGNQTQFSQQPKQSKWFNPTSWGK